MTIETAVLEALHDLPLFAALPEDELRVLAERLRPMPFADGAAVLREGEECDEFYILTLGQVDVVKSLGTPDERLLAVRPAGTVVGELSLFSAGGRHTASVLAHGPLETLVMTRTEFNGLLSRQPRLAYSMVQMLSLRLIESEQSTIRDLHIKNDALARALVELQAAQAELVEKEKLEHELEVARRIQSSLLPQHWPQRPGLDIAASVRPMSAVGGDFYDFVEFPDGRIGIAVGDVSDHGVPAALFMTMTVTLLRTAARREAGGQPAAPADVLRSVNRGLLEFNMSGMFVTLLYGVLDPRRREFAYARAGHEPPLLHLWTAPALSGAPRAADESGMWIVDRSAWGAASAPPPAPARRKGKGTLPLREKTTNPLGKRAAGDEGRTTEDKPASTATPNQQPGLFAKPASSFQRGQILGVVPDPELDAQSLPLPEHSLLLLYTDGAREAWNPAGAMFGEKGLRGLLAEAASQPAQGICERIFEHLAAFRGSAPQQDDITLVAVRT